MKRFMVHGSWFMVILSWTMNYELSTMNYVYAQESSSQDALTFGRADYLFRQRQFDLALEEFGRLPKEAQQDPEFQRRIAASMAALYRSTRRGGTAPQPRPIAPMPRATQNLRVTQRKTDADAGSDQVLDNRGWQVNEFLEAKIPTDRFSHRFELGVDGFRDGKNDLRAPRRISYQLADATLQLTLGDARDYLSRHRTLEFGDPEPVYTGYTLRSVQYRGLDFNWKTEQNQFHLMAGLVPFYLSDEEQYVYPRRLIGIRDSYRLNDRYRVGLAVSQVRDTEKIRTLDTVNQPRSTEIFSLEQDLALIPKVWTINLESAYSQTDDNLLSDRFGNNIMLKDFAHHLTSLVSLPGVRWATTFERVGPDFRAPQDVAAIGVSNSKTLTADRQHFISQLTLRPKSAFDLALAYSQTENNLDDDSGVERIRQRWVTADLGIRTPPAWPRPRLRETLTETVSVPGSITRPSQIRTSETELELSRRIERIDLTGFGSYEIEQPMKDTKAFNQQDRWSLGTRLARPFGNRILGNLRTKYEVFDETFDTIRERGKRIEINGGGSLRLWSTASLSLNHSFLNGKLVDPRGTRIAHGAAHASTANFTWPYVHASPDKRRKFSISPALTYHFTEFSRHFEKRPLFAGRLGLGYEVYPNWRLEMVGEFRHDDDQEDDLVRTQESRFWILWTSRWN